MPTTATVFSLAMLFLLWRENPKRRRTARLPGGNLTLASRQLCVMAALLPGIILALQGNASAFLMWLGSCAVGGWMIANFHPIGSGRQ